MSVLVTFNGIIVTTTTTIFTSNTIATTAASSTTAVRHLAVQPDLLAANITLPALVPSYHIVFSTGCSSFQEWQAYILFYNMMRLNQTGSVTRVASCANDEDAKSVHDYFDQCIKSMPTSERFHLHITPGFNFHNGTYYRVSESMKETHASQSRINSHALYLLHARQRWQCNFYMFCIRVFIIVGTNFVFVCYAETCILSFV
jgi:hypothetical protein